mmetsp:Transcript_5246/g.21641  ORF Transcript_5246/g.21641 Transcript_5246/m.21641 type:complete len:117 (+) Transcript_5246:606-956(+)
MREERAASLCGSPRGGHVAVLAPIRTTLFGVLVFGGRDYRLSRREHRGRSDLAVLALRAAAAVVDTRVGNPHHDARDPDPEEHAAVRNPLHGASPSAAATTAVDNDDDASQRTAAP